MKMLHLAVAVWAAAHLLQAAPVPPAERLLPENTLAVMTIPDYPAHSEWYNSTPGGKWFSDPAMKPFLDKFTAKFKKDVLEPLEKELGLKFADYEGLAQGQLTLAVTAARWEGTSRNLPALVLLMDTRGKSDQLQRNLAEIQKKWKAAGKPMKTETVRGAEFTAYTIMSDDLRAVFERVFPDPNAGWESITPAGPRGGARRPAAKPENREINLLVGQSGTLLVIGTSASEIRKVLDLQAGEGGRCLADAPAFQADQKLWLRGAQAYGWVNLNAIVDLALKGVEDAGPQPGNNPMAVSAPQVVKALGLTGAQSALFAMQGDRQGATVHLFLGVPEAQRRGLFKLMSPVPEDASPPPFVPADAVKFTRIRYNFGNAWETLEQTLNNINPGLLGALAFFEGALKQQDPNFTLKRGLIDNLGDDLISYEFKPTAQTLEGISAAPGLIMLSSPAPDKLAATVKSLASFATTMAQARGPRGGRRDAEPPALKERQFQGRTIYSFPPMPQMNLQGQRIGERTLSFCAAGNYVAFSFDNAVLEQFIRGGKPARNLASTPGLAEAAKAAGGYNTGMFYYENQAETMRALWNALKKDGVRIGELLAMTPLGGRLGLADDNKAFQDWFDFNLLPPFDRVSKYFGMTVYTGSATPEGLLIKAYTPNPPTFK